MKRIVLLLLAFWLPAQGFASIAMPFCGTHGSDGSHVKRGWHAVHLAHHGVPHDSQGLDHQNPAADPWASQDGNSQGLPSCDGCSMCQQCSAPTLPAATVSARPVIADTQPTLAVLPPRPVFLASFQRPPLS
jgi:hypothetical protein